MSDDQRPTSKKETYVCHWEIIQYPDGREFRVVGSEEGERPPHLIDPIELSSEQLRKVVRKRREILSGEHYEIMNGFHLEFEEIWSCILQLQRRTDAGDSTEWKKTALKRFADSERQWKYVTEDILNNDGVWSVSRGGHEKGDVRSKMFEKVLESRDKKLLYPPSGGKAYGAQFFAKYLKLLD